MSAQEFLVHVMAKMQPLLPYMLVVVAATGAVLPALLLLSRGLWVDLKRFRFLGLFFSLNTGECICLACAWTKLIILLSILIAFQKPDAPRYLLFLAPAVLYAVWPRRITHLPGRVLWQALESAALISCGLICGYIHDMQAGLRYRAIYAAMALFTALFGIYLFLVELDDISAGRKADLEQYRKAYTDHE